MPFFVLCTGIASLAVGATFAEAAQLRIGVQKTGTFAWELAVIKAHGLDKQADLDIEIVDLATTEAGKIALGGGSVDMILSDWLWVSRERGLGHKLTFYPYSSAVGAVMVQGGSNLHALGDLKGKTIGVAGGPLDKSWLMLQAYSKQSGFDIAHEAHVLFGAPPLLTEKAAQGELDATLQFWNFSADLEQRGFQRLIDMQEIEKGLGAKAAVAMVGYVFDEDFAAKNAAALAKFFAITRQAKEILIQDEKEWPPIMARIGQKNPGALAIYRTRYSDGVPRRKIEDEEADALILFKTLAEAGGAELVGSSTALDPGTYYKPKL